jgi:hypothetical protein
MTDVQLYTKLSALPPDLKKEAEDFIDFLLSKIKSQPVNQLREPGLAKGLITMKDNFDDPLEEFEEYM